MATEDNDNQTWAQVMADNAVNVGDRDNDTKQTIDADEVVAIDSESGDNDRNADIEADVGSAVSESAITQTRAASRRPRGVANKIEPRQLKPTVGDNNQISVANHSKSIDFKLWLRTVDDDNIAKRVELMAGEETEEEMVFAALFDDGDYDFEIVAHNQSKTFDLWLEITYDWMRKFVVKKGERLVFKTLDNNGYRLRFLTPNRPKGQTYSDVFPAGELDANTTIHFVSNYMAFNVWYGECMDDMESTEDEPKAKRVKTEEGVHNDVTKRIALKVRDKKSQNIACITIAGNQTIDELKNLIEERMKISVGRQRLVANGGATLEGSQTIDECELEDKSTVWVFHESSGKEKKKPVVERHVYIKNEKIHVVSTGGGTDGESGALGYGQRTRECFGPKSDFWYREKYSVKYFKIEFKVKKAYESPEPSTSGPSIKKPVLIELDSD